MNQAFNADNPGKLIEQLQESDRRLLLLGLPGSGKTTLAGQLALALDAVGRRVWCLAADPGMPAFGVPGAINLGIWLQGKWALTNREALCSLDAARFRLPLTEAVGRLAAKVDSATLLLDAPGVVRGVAGAELLTALARIAAVDLVVVLVHQGQQPPLQQELESLDVQVIRIEPSSAAHRPGKRSRDRERTRLWDGFLEGAQAREIALSELQMLGTPPRNAPDAWLGKQVAFLDRETTLGMGEVVGMQGDTLRVLLPPGENPAPLLLVRDAVRDSSGLLVTGKRFAENVVRYLPPSDLVPDSRLETINGARPMVQTGSASAVLMNGVFGDPQLHLRLAHQRRSLLFDLGDGARLPARLAHQISDVFISHAHMDHISGFLWLLRSRIGESNICRLYGPPGLAQHVAHLVNGIHWDRIGERGPRFEVAELHGERLLRFALQAGMNSRRQLDETPVEGGILLAESGFKVRAVTLEHGIPVLAYAFEPVPQIKLREARLLERGLTPGPWITELKQHILGQQANAPIDLPDGSVESAGTLAADLTLIAPDDKLVYATDLADTPGNRSRLAALATQAHTLFCEAPFLQREAAQAKRTGHLTTTACAEIANAAGVRHLVPFHFSRRYEEAPWQIYDEIAACCPQLVLPPGRQKFRQE